MKNKILFILAPLALYPVMAQALTYEKGSDGATRTIEDYIKNYVDTPKDAIDWKVFGSTKSIDIKTKDKNGYDLEYEKPDFQKPILDLEGKQIKIKGFMFPLDPTDDQKFFLFGPFPITCPFHYHVGPALVVEVHADKSPVRFSYDPVILTGKLELVKEDQDNSAFYRLQDAKMVKE